MTTFPKFALTCWANTRALELVLLRLLESVQEDEELSELEAEDFGRFCGIVLSSKGYAKRKAVNEVALLSSYKEHRQRSRVALS